MSDVTSRPGKGSLTRQQQGIELGIACPCVSIMATWKGNLRAGMVANKVFGLLEGTPKQYVFTPNSDTPYSGLPLDVSDGPMVLEFPPGPLMSTMNDLNQRWVMDMGLPGPDQGRGGRHLVLPPSY